MQRITKDYQEQYDESNLKDWTKKRTVEELNEQIRIAAEMFDENQF